MCIFFSFVATFSVKLYVLETSMCALSHLKPYQLFNFTIAFTYIDHASEYAENASEYVKGATKASHLKPYQLFNFTIAFEYIHHASEYAENVSEYVESATQGLLT